MPKSVEPAFARDDRVGRAYDEGEPTEPSELMDDVDRCSAADPTGVLGRDDEARARVDAGVDDDVTSIETGR